ncbi:Flavoprotein-like domain protein [Raphanus sativus]|nr:Flavoprotein-like domain protein [Raphanus sativus]
MSAPPKNDAPLITPNDLAEADGFVFGFPTRFSMMAAQFIAFLDATGGLWRTQQLAGKPAGIFYSTRVSRWWSRNHRVRFFSKRNLIKDTSGSYVFECLLVLCH